MKRTNREPANETDWIPPPGTTKLRCPECRKWFASRDGARVCPICVPGARTPRSSRASDSPFDYMGDGGGRAR